MIEKILEQLKPMMQESIEAVLMKEFKGWTITYDYDGNTCDHEAFAYECARSIVTELTE